MSKKKRPLPPMEKISNQLFGPNVTGYAVGSWTNTPDGSGPAIAVGISFKTVLPITFSPIPVDMVLRLKSPAAVDEMIQILLRHKRDVWPDAP